MEFLIFLSPSCKAPFVRPSFAARSKEKERGEKKPNKKAGTESTHEFDISKRTTIQKKIELGMVLVFILLLSSSIEITR